MSRDENDGHVVAYAVAIDDDVVWMVGPADLRATGGRRSREDYMSGESLRVSPYGRVLD